MERQPVRIKITNNTEALDNQVWKNIPLSSRGDNKK
jgi:hypothetical protein